MKAVKGAHNPPRQRAPINTH